MHNRFRRRYVVLFHVHPTDGDHYDLMIEAGSTLATWRAMERPESASADHPVNCLQIGNHRTVYLDYEGPVSGNRGHVRQHDVGHCTTSTLGTSRITVRFAGNVLNGDFVLERDEGAADQWRLRLA